MGAHYAGADAARQECFARFGHYLGIAFQIADDLLDVLGEEATTGKSLGTDLLKQKLTLPMIRLLDQVSEKERAEVEAVLAGSGNHHRQALKPWFERFDAVSYAREKARWYSRRAVEELGEVPESSAREMLKGLADFVISRQK